MLEDDQGERSLEFDALLIATGRKPTVKGLGFADAGIEYDERLGVKVNDRMQTTNPDVYAVGDVASKYQFTHMSDFGARLVIRNALFFGRDKFSNLIVSWATYTEPEVAHVGLYEKDPSPMRRRLQPVAPDTNSQRYIQPSHGLQTLTRLIRADR